MKEPVGLFYFVKCNFWIKIGVMALVGLFIALEVWSKCQNIEYVIIDYFFTIISGFIIWTGSEYISSRVSGAISWEEPMKRISLMLFFNLLFVLPTMTILLWLNWSIHPIYNFNLAHVLTYNIYTLCTTAIINLVFIGIELFGYWRESVYEIEKLKQENLRSQLETLKNQVNPHFLFNSLNTLISIIDDEPETAKNYTQKLSQVYRYILQAREKDVVSLKEELDFTNAYDFLLKIRYGDNLHFHIHVDEKYLDYAVPTLVLQMLVENAIKHNVISASKPLDVKISIDENENLIVANNYQPKKVNLESNKVGLKNIAERYRILENKEIEIIQTNEYFMVRLPLIR